MKHQPGRTLKAREFFRRSYDRLVQTQENAGTLWALSVAIDSLVPVGVLQFWKPRTVLPSTLSRQTSSILTSWGVPDNQVDIMLRHMMYADLRGIDSHGCAMLSKYHEWLREGRIEVTPRITVVNESSTTALIDGGGGLGHVPAHQGMNLAIEKALSAGVGVVVVRNSGHFGAAGAYSSMAAEAGLIGLASTNTYAPSVVPTFAAEARLGTNPISFSAPSSDGRHFALDMATSTVPLGRVAGEWTRGRSIPRGWGADRRGRPSRNGRKAADARRLTPLGRSFEMGGHKGYGLAAMVGILTGVLPGFSPQAKDTSPVGHFFLALDPRKFLDQDEKGDGFPAAVGRFLDHLRSSQPLLEEQPVLVAGDPERAAFEERSRHGVPLSRWVFEDIRAIARASNVEFVLETEFPF